jgi:hypothetical protein
MGAAAHQIKKKTSKEPQHELAHVIFSHKAAFPSLKTKTQIMLISSLSFG